MRSMKIISVLLVGLLTVVVPVVADSSGDEVTLVVSDDGSSKEEAVNMALRSAIEQAYGAFVSSNTTILNDALVNDEIATISSGNIKDYQEITGELLPDGRFYVTLRATVRITKLISYVQSKGVVETSFAGASLSTNIAMMELNKENEKKVLENLWKVIKTVYPLTFDYQMIIGEPSLQKKNTGDIIPTSFHYFIEATPLNMEYYELGFSVNVVFNESARDLENYIYETLNSIKLTKDEEREYKELNISMYSINDWCSKLLDYSLYKNLPSSADVSKGKNNSHKVNSIQKKGNKGANGEAQGLFRFVNERAYTRSALSFYENDKLFFSKARSRFNIIDNNGNIVATGDGLHQKGDSFTFSVRIPKDIIAEFTGFKLVRTN